MAMLTTKSNLKIRHATLEDRNRLANLTHFEAYVHRHLDWRTPLEWLGAAPFMALEQRNEIVAALACPPEAPEIAWIRLFAVGHAISYERAWSLLWPETQNLLQEMGYQDPVAAIPLWPWFSDLLAREGFAELDRVVMLAWDAGRPVPETRPTGATYRPMIFSDLEEVQAVDQAAFKRAWQNSLTSLELAYRQSAVASIAQVEGKLVGYQISTTTPVGGHLARLAVLPEFQGQGIGSKLVYDLIARFKQMAAQRITVNTQKNNLGSLSLYQKMGFSLTGEDYPVLQYQIGA